MKDRAQRVLITGASRGIGQAIAKAFNQVGYEVIGTATSPAGADAITSALQTGAGGKGFCLDLNHPASLAEFEKRIAEENLFPDVVVNNAGITRDNLLLRMSDDDWSDVINTNLTAVFKLSRFLIKPMLKKRAGRLINISSIIGVTGNPGQCNYASAKAGLIGLTKALALEVASRGVTVNAVAPGFIETDMTAGLPDATREAMQAKIPLKRFGRVEDVAQAVLFLASDAAGYITGETLHINGGLFMN